MLLSFEYAVKGKGASGYDPIPEARMHILTNSRQALSNLSPTAIACLSVMLLASMPASAQEDQSDAVKQRNLALGIAAVTMEKPYTGFDRKNYVFPMVSYENRWVSASVPTFDFKINEGDTLSLRLRARWSGDGYEASDSTALTGMQERKGSVWAGAAGIWKTPFAKFSAEYLVDATNESKGARAKLQVDRRFSVGRFGLTPRLAAEWVDDKYVDYYFGVRPEEATAVRQAHLGEATTNLQGGIRVDYMPSSHHAIFLDVGVTQFGTGIKDSPLVDKSSQMTIAGGYVYRF